MNQQIFTYYNKLLTGSLSHIVYSALFIGSFLCIYLLINTILNKKVTDHFKRKKIRVGIRNLLFFLLSIILISLWAGQIKTMLLSTAAITAAIIIIFKEVILSFFASFYITSNNLISIGDIVEYEGLRGRVVDRNFSGIKIQSNSIEENRLIFIPNIVFFTGNVINFAKIENFKLNSITIGLKSAKELIEFTKILEKKMPEMLNLTLEDHKNKLKEEELAYNDEGFDYGKNYYIK